MKPSWNFWLFRVFAIVYALLAFLKFLADDMDGYYQRFIVSLLFELLARALERRGK